MKRVVTRQEHAEHLGATDNGVTAQNNATLGIEETQDMRDDPTGQPPVLNSHVDESDEEEFIFPGAETVPTRETPPSPSPQPLKSTLNPTAMPFAFRPAETQKEVGEPADLPEPTIETADLHDDSEEEEFEEVV